MSRNSLSKKRIAVVNSHPIQYFAPLYAYLNRDPDLEITALYCSDFSLRGATDPGFKQQIIWDIDLLRGYPSVFLGKRAKRRSPRGFFSLVCPEVWNEIRSGRYDVLWLHGYNYAAYVIAFFAAKSINIPVFMRTETHIGLQRAGLRRGLRDGILSIAYRFIDGFLAIGTANRDYYLELGVPARKIFSVPYAVDNDRFIPAAQLTPEERAGERRRFGLHPDLPVVLYASKFMPRKHPDDVLRAMAVICQQGLRATLFMVGTGEMEDDLRALAKQLQLDNIVFGGFINQVELPKAYAVSDIFVLPAKCEPWGLIVNEVMCAGLPVVASDEVGCVGDLVHDGDNGLHIRAGDVQSLHHALGRLICDDQLRSKMGQRSLQIIRGWSYEQCRIGLQTAVKGVEASK